MKIGVISDTHIPERASSIPQKIIDDFKSADMIIHAGDLVTVSVLDKLKAICPNVKAVAGNMDPSEVRKVLPEKEIIHAGKFRIGLMHGSGVAVNLLDKLSLAFKDDKVDIIVFGHSHAPFNEKKNGILFFNPGSATDKISSAHNSYGIIELNDKIEARVINL